MSNIGKLKHYILDLKIVEHCCKIAPLCDHRNWDLCVGGGVKKPHIPHRRILGANNARVKTDPEIHFPPSLGLFLCKNKIELNQGGVLDRRNDVGDWGVGKKIK